MNELRDKSKIDDLLIREQCLTKRRAELQLELAKLTEALCDLKNMISELHGL